MSNLATIVNNILADSGIDDINVVVTTGSYNNPAWITALSWGKISSTPTTLSGYGITDAVPSSRTLTINGTSYDLSANRSWTIAAGVSSIIAGTGISVSGSGNITVTNTGVLSINGSTGAITGIITTSNYNSYSPTLTGGGASGTWGINITGTAGSISGFNNPTTAATANTTVYRDSNAYIYAAYYNAPANSASPTTVAPTSMIGRATTSDKFYYDFTAGAVAAFISGQSMNIAGNASTATAAQGATFLTQPNATWGARLQIGGNGGGSAVANIAVVQATDGNLHMDNGVGKSMYLNYYENGIIYLNGATYYISANGANYNGNAATATYSLNSTRLYASDAPYTYGGAAPYYMYMTYDGSRWLLQVSPASPSAVRVSYADSSGSSGSASTAGTVTHNAGRTDSAWYNAVWASGTPSPMYSCDSVQIQSSTGAIRANNFRFFNSTNNAVLTGDGSWGFKSITSDGYIWFGPANTGHAHIYTDRPNFYFNRDLLVNGVSVVTNSGTWSISITGNSATATNLSNSYTTWGSIGGYSSVVGMLAWKNYGNNHVIFDASQGTSPDGVSVNQTNSANAWSASYPTLMGWNGASTYGVRVDSARVSDSAGYATTAGSAPANGGTATASTYLNPNYAGGQQLNPQVYFNNGIGVKVAMTGAAGYWSDTLWINGYSGGDVLSMCALHTQRNGTPRMYISTQQGTASAYGTLYEFLTSYNAIYALNMNQNLRTTDSPTFANIYAVGGWFRTFDNNGLYNETHANHWYASSGTDWNIGANGGTAAIIFRTQGYQGNIRGFVYADSSSNIGFLGFDGNWAARLDSSKNLTVTGDVTAYSDIRVKTNIKTITGALDKVISLRGVYYNRIDNGDDSQKLGVIAQEIQKILPQVVKEQSDGMLSVSYGNIVGVLIEAIKEQQTQIEELKKSIN